MKNKSSDTFSKLSEKLGRRPKNQTDSIFALALHSGKTINKVTKVWTHIYQSQPFSGAEANVSKPIHFQSGKLTIECNSPTLLNHLRFNQSHLIQQLHKYGFKEINSLQLTVKHKSNQISFPDNQAVNKNSNTKNHQQKLSQSSLNMIESCAKTTNTPTLNKSLNNLLKSLESIDTKKDR